ncbi:triose-phosphate isomerase [Enterobacteriaceae bacterium ET-AT1-13]|nr:triose-phosphate isomerase [Enterobacteriaceae bacterium ET-AT1-13]WGS66378.1 triose-phosphate isomerase [Enterobacteriaceae bacterium Cmel17]WMC17404.1 MAG: triose-phosphate isomerase [Enterobacteriaceae bacterium Cmel21]WMC17610.1 MAG: triose-phosphate isomerase [Enterobacteriaceae bacterium PSmelAO3-2]WMC17815.1 MAG: triose-phosphate isomerase [Enterobacteriaceae bacterium PSmelAO3-1]WMC18018.1 MAG: triose-phosphate isomerase [Enterobacteriaceae bacterium PSmelAO1]
MKFPLIIANWKLNGNKYFVNVFLKKLCYKLNKKKLYNIAIAPPLVYLHTSIKEIKNTNITICAQNVDVNLSGAFTGDVSISMLKDIGVKYVLIGHSERRIYHNETDFEILKKFINVKKNNLIPILCIGETLEEKKKNKTKEICFNQINLIIKNLGIKVFKNCVIAYEPVWAIGNKVSANFKDVQKIHKFIRSTISLYDKKISKQIIIQYGGSVNYKNAKELLMQQDIDGLLIGNSSLNINNFLKIIKILKN